MSVALSATTVDCPDTDMLVKLLVAVALFVIVKESFVALVVSVIPVPATNVKMSVALSATTSLCPDTDIVEKLFDEGVTLTELITPCGSIVTLVPSTLTPPRIVVLAIGKLYALAELITPLLIVIVEPSILTPPNAVVLAIGSV